MLNFLEVAQRYLSIIGFIFSILILFYIAEKFFKYPLNWFDVGFYFYNATLIVFEAC